MKTKFLLFLLLSPTLLFAQKFELGSNAGASINSKATNNMFYKGDGVAINVCWWDFSALMNVQNNIQFGVEAHMLELARLSSDIHAAGYTPEARTDGKKFVYSDFAVSYCGVLNKKLKTDYGYFYGGLAMGVAVARNFWQHTPNGYASYIAPDGGVGLVVGAQMGYTYYATKHFGFNFEAAIRYMDLDYPSQAPVVTPKTNLHYRVVAYPVTAGIRYIFGYKKDMNAPEVK